MTQNEIINMAEFCFEKSKNQIEFIELFSKLVAQHEREACANTAGLALLGADKALSDRVLKAIRARGQA
jgi:hypothetical protein